MLGDGRQSVSGIYIRAVVLVISSKFIILAINLLAYHDGLKRLLIVSFRQNKTTFVATDLQPRSEESLVLQRTPFTGSRV